jgi:hypothetical protein
MDHKEDLQLACTRTAFITMIFTLIAQLIEDPCMKEKEDDGGMGMVY